MRKIYTLLSLLLICNVLTAQSDLSGLTICLDPGHGNYPHDKPYETRINLPVANYLKSYLEEYGAQVIVTRQDSAKKLSLSQRESIANSNNVDFFHSIHHNAFKQNANYSLMLFEEKSNGSPEWPGESDEMCRIMADYLYRYLYTTGKYARGDRSFLGFNLGVLNDLMMPGVLSEASFWDYVPEIHRLNSLDYLKLEAFAMLHSYLNYFEVPKKTTTWLEGVVQDSERQNLSRVQVTLTNGDQNLQYITDSHNIGITAQDNSWSSFPYVAEVHNGLYFFENFPSGEAQLIFSGDDLINDTLAVVISDSTSTRVAPVKVVFKTPPQIEFVYPYPDDRQNVKINSQLAFEFTKPMNPNSLIEAFQLEPAVDSLTFKFFKEDKQFRVFPVPNLAYSTEYTVTFDGSIARDKWGFYLDGNFDGQAGGNFVTNFKTRANESGVAPSDQRNSVYGFALFQNFPNPFNGETTIPFRIFQPASQVQLEIFNAQGRKIRIYKNLNPSPGAYRIRWNLAAKPGKPVASGIYYYKLRIDNHVETKRMIYLR